MRKNRGNLDMKQVGRKNNKTTHTNKKQLKNEEKEGKPGDEAGWEKKKQNNS